jgi:hydroxylamine reductase
MFCNQCEQTSKETGCTVQGVCGKTPDVAALQDLLVFSLKGISILAMEARKHGKIDDNLNDFTVKALFATLTNVNFDPAEIVELIKQAVQKRESLKAQIESFGGENDFIEESVVFTPSFMMDEMTKQGAKVGTRADVSNNPDVQSLHQILTYGVKGLAAYAYHAAILGKKDDEIFDFVYRALASTRNPTLSVEELVGLVLECGRINLRAMELLDAANTETYGHPVPTKVPLGVRKGKAILVSGHDLKDLEEILKQTVGKGIYVYTHGEMLPAHGYPRLKKFRHFHGHYGTAWQNQQKEFAAFPGAILMTTNCIQKPLENYKESIFTSGPVEWPGVTHIDGPDFSPVIEKALEMPGFSEDRDDKCVTVGFARNAVLSVADKVVDAVKKGHIRHFFLVGGCDGAKPGRSYYTEFVEKAPKDTLVLTLACGKFRFFDKDLGEIDGIPRLLDIGQCNDAYSAVKIAQALSETFKVGVNDLPLSLILSWYEQKAVAILLSLLYLGVRNIRLGPSLPVFITPNVLKVLVEKFNIMPIKTASEDLRSILARTEIERK